MWSTGCVLGEMLIGSPLFQGDSNINQLIEIIKVLGCPTNQEITEMNPNHDMNKFQLPKIAGKTLQKVLRYYTAKVFTSAGYLGDHFIDLMKKVLTYSPAKRLTPAQALAHPFFNELREEKLYR